MQSKLIIPILVFAVVLWRIYMRTRRSFGRQRVQPRRIAVRIGILGLFGVVLIALSAATPWSVAGIIAGAACGALLSLLALRHTQIEGTPEGRFYTPHTVIGLILTVSFLARLIYDFMLFRHEASLAVVGARSPVFHESPLTLAVSGAFIGYYIAYFLGVLRRSRPPVGTTPAMPSDPQ